MRQAHWRAVALAGTVLASVVARAAEPVVRWVAPPGDPSKAVVEVTGLPEAELQPLRVADVPVERWQALLAVYALPPGVSGVDTKLPPMLGAYRVDAGAIRFTPRFPLASGVVYNAVLRSAGTKSTTANYQLSARAQKDATVVSAIYPSADVLPENLLKFYLHFSAPMSGGQIYSHIHLRDADGRDVELPFLELDQELWDAAMTRVTLLLDPGRIKRGVRPLVEVGSALHEGGRYSLVIDREWKDAAGQPLREAAIKSFRVAPADRTPIDPKQWQLRAPAAGTRAPLEVSIGEPLDRALALRLISVATTGGAAIEGDASLTQQERQWNFTPDAAWRAGDYRLVIATTIEDLAGNNVGKPFDVDVFERVDRRLPSETVTVEFTVR